MEKMNLQPELKGQLVELRPLKREDFEHLHAAASDPLIWEQHPARDRYKIEVFKSFFEEGIESGGAFAILDATSPQKPIVGSTRFYDYDSKKNQVCVGYTFLARKVWGGAVNSEMKTLLLKHAFQSVESVLFHIGEKNIRSRRAIEKIGAKLFDRIDKHKQLADGTWLNTVIYRIQNKA
jgi:RimJ/RimL family protein N-acetyltransferase